MIFPAHIRIDETGKEFVQTVQEHNRNCAVHASANIIGKMKNTAYLAGLLHDLGKFTVAFKGYLTKAARGEPVRRGEVNHTFAGVRFVMERWHIGSVPGLRELTSEILAFAIGAHHGQFDCIDSSGANGFQHRMRKEGIHYEEAKENFLRYCAGLDELDALFAKAEQEIAEMLEHLKDYAQLESDTQLGLALLSRMLLSAVVDADRQDTCEFMHGAAAQEPPQDTPPSWNDILHMVEAKIADIPQKQTIDHVRREISAQCGQAVRLSGGIYRLALPTGAGKTLVGLRLGLATAAAYQKQRIIFTIPLLSILEQNAAVIRDYIGDGCKVLEHHSNVVQESSGKDELNENELRMETWNAPVVITTLVQLLNTLFAGKNSSVRRMGSLSNSVLVIDEVQSVPRKMLSLFNAAINFLAYACDVTVILCSATQPCLESTAHPLQYQEPADIVPYDPQMWEVFRRTEIIDKRKPGGYTIDELASFLQTCAEQEGNVLMICNTKGQARELYHAVKQISSAKNLHLSAAMCMEHRVQTLEEIAVSLEEGPVICISTQLVEAGVDISFACVVRMSAGMDNIVQSAGRCNRSGELERLCPVYIVNMQGENLKFLKEIQQAQLAAESVLADFAEHPDVYENNLASEASIRAYYRRLYTDMPEKAQDYAVPNLNTTIYAMLSDNANFRPLCTSGAQYIIGQAFKAAGEAFSVFDDDTVDVLVPFGEGAELIADLCSVQAGKDWEYANKLLKKAKRFSISLYRYEFNKLKDLQAIYSLLDGAVFALQPGYYSEETGLRLDGGADWFEEV